VECGEDILPPIIEQRGIGQGSGRDNAGDLPVHRPLGGRRVADLLADRHRLALPYQLREVLLQRVKRHPRHADRIARRGTARGQRDVEQPRGAFCVLVKEFVEIAHAVEQQLVRMLRLDAEVLLHHRRMLIE
jgi:hypothetical protein